MSVNALDTGVNLVLVINLPFGVVLFKTINRSDDDQPVERT